MRPGRPTQHIRATYLSYEDNDEVSYYSLDKKGNLMRDNGSIVLHHKKIIEMKGGLIEEIVYEPSDKISEPMSPETPQFVETNIEDFDEIRFTDFPDIPPSLAFPEINQSFLTFTDKLEEYYNDDPFAITSAPVGMSYSNYMSLCE